MTGFWSDCPIPRVNPEESAYEFFDDFTKFSVGDNTGIWTLDQTNGSAVLVSSEAATGKGGVVRIGTDGTADNDYATIKVTTADTGAAFRIEDGATTSKKLWFAARVYPYEVTDCSYYVGLFDQTTTEPGLDDTGAENLGAAQDGVYFRSLNGTPTELDFCCAKNGSETEVKGAAGTLAATTWITVGFKYDGNSTVQAWINGVKVATVMSTSLTNFPDDVGLTPLMFVKDGEATGEIKYLYCDWIKCVQER